MQSKYITLSLHYSLYKIITKTKRIMSNIKSERAAEYLSLSECTDKKTSWISILARDAEKAVLLAEEDAEDRAVKAYCKTVCPCFSKCCDEKKETCEHLGKFKQLLNPCNEDNIGRI